MALDRARIAATRKAWTAAKVRLLWKKEFPEGVDDGPPRKKGFLNVSITERVGSATLRNRWDASYKRRVLVDTVQRDLPRPWWAKVHQLAQAATQTARFWERDLAAVEVYKDWLGRYTGTADLDESAIRQRAEEIAARALAIGHFNSWAVVRDFAERHGAQVKTNTKQKRELSYWAARIVCPRWWRAQLRRLCARKFEFGSIELGNVGAHAGAWYCTNQAVITRQKQLKANEQALRNMRIEAPDTGARMTVWDAAQRSVSNKAIRRGELMTRIRGCEEWADENGMAGIFTTNTCPSKFHAQLHGGGRNPRWLSLSPADAQKWLSGVWARLRAKWSRDKVRVFGFRVAEPHHDGTPHWHMLLWCAPADLEYVKDTMQRWWLSEDGDEPGALKYRCKVMDMEPGKASGYVAKYISKNIDDDYTETHADVDAAPGMTVGPDLLGDMEIKPCMRVEAWASRWGIRQFQAIGQPPVTVWRELRRVDETALAGASHEVIKAWLSSHRKRDRLADWAGYMRAQGGAMQGREAYRLCVHTVERERLGRYGQVRDKWACGVRNRAAGGDMAVTPSKRVAWGTDGFSAARSAAPWTRFNNCTPPAVRKKCLQMESVDSGCALDSNSAVSLKKGGQKWHAHNSTSSSPPSWVTYLSR